METGWQVTRTKELNVGEGCARRTVKELDRVDVTEGLLRQRGAVGACQQESAEG